MQQVRGIELEQATGERGRLLGIRRKVHDVDAQQHHGRRIVYRNRELAVRAWSHDPETGLHLIERCAGSTQSYEKAFDVVFREHHQHPKQWLTTLRLSEPDVS